MTATAPRCSNDLALGIGAPLPGLELRTDCQDHAQLALQNYLIPFSVKRRSNANLNRSRLRSASCARLHISDSTCIDVGAPPKFVRRSLALPARKFHLRNLATPTPAWQ